MPGRACSRSTRAARCSSTARRSSSGPTATSSRSWGCGRRTREPPVADRVVRAGVVGVGALGRHHARVWADLPGTLLVGVHDSEDARAAEVAERHGCRAYPDVDALLADVEAVSVAVPTVAHHSVAKQAL